MLHSSQVIDLREGSIKSSRLWAVFRAEISMHGSKRKTEEGKGKNDRPTLVMDENPWDLLRILCLQT